MDSKQIDIAMRNKTPVMYNGQQYVRILEYVMWYDKQGKRLFPDVDLRRTERCRKDDDGMAEALLLACYAQRRM